MPTTAITLRKACRILPLICLLFILSFTSVRAQNFNAGIDIQAYPTGVIPGLLLEWESAGVWSYQARIGHNIVRHRDLGEHDDERGSGWGGSLAVIRAFDERWHLGIRTDLWFNDIDWKDNIDTPNEVSGNSDVTVLQPTLIGYYAIPLGERSELRPNLGFGVEINIETDGADTGEGLILLAGVSLVFTL